MNNLEKLRHYTKLEHEARGLKNTQANYKKLVKEIMATVDKPDAFEPGSNMAELRKIMLGG